ncbi:hypothetical protein HDU67_005833 [Dinochytrium kinnereticum]|nr:hypothetical protein HDU67_005833 [Dinochytrium kinnereticum]
MTPNIGHRPDRSNERMPSNQGIAKFSHDAGTETGGHLPVPSTRGSTTRVQVIGQPCQSRSHPVPRNSMDGMKQLGMESLLVDATPLARALLAAAGGAGGQQLHVEHSGRMECGKVRLHASLRRVGEGEEEEKVEGWCRTEFGWLHADVQPKPQSPTFESPLAPVHMALSVRTNLGLRAIFITLPRDCFHIGEDLPKGAEAMGSSPGLPSGCIEWGHFDSKHLVR